MNKIEKGTVIAAVKAEEFESALQSDAQWIIDLSPDLNTLRGRACAVHDAEKKLLIHFDLATGIGKDWSGMLFAGEAGVDGIVSTRVNVIKMARKAGLFTVQRFFIVDSHSIETTIEALNVSRADMIEVMPGIVSKIIGRLAQRIDVPIIAGGLIETETEFKAAIDAGATAISTGNKELWKAGVRVK